MAPQSIRLCEQGERRVIWKCTWFSVAFLILWASIAYCLLLKLPVGQTGRRGGQKGVGRENPDRPWDQDW